MIRIGISGWRYPPWRGDFYPAGLPQRRELGYAASQLSSIEINGSFYSLQRPTSWARWHAEVPDDFVFAVKGGRFLTHMLRLHDVEVPLANFFASGVLALGGKLGPVVYVRLHGDTELYASGYTDEALDEWAEKLRGWTSEGRDAFVYFDNDILGYAPHDARKLMARPG